MLVLDIQNRKLTSESSFRYPGALQDTAGGCDTVSANELLVRPIINTKKKLDGYAATERLPV